MLLQGFLDEVLSSGANGTPAQAQIKRRGIEAKNHRAHRKRAHRKT